MNYLFKRPFCVPSLNPLVETVVVFSMRSYGLLGLHVLSHLFVTYVFPTTAFSFNFAKESLEEHALKKKNEGLYFPIFPLVNLCYTLSRSIDNLSCMVETDCEMSKTKARKRRQRRREKKIVQLQLGTWIILMMAVVVGEPAKVEKKT